MIAPAFRGARVIGASWDNAAAPPLLDRLLAACDGWHIRRGAGWLLATEHAAFAHDDERVAVGTTTQQLLDRGAATLRDARSLATLVVNDPAAVDALAPPYRLIWADVAGNSIHAACDRAGLGHLFVAAEQGLELCASSATLLAGIIDAPADRVGLAAFAQLGTFPFATTPYAGVTKLLAGERALLTGGRLAVTPPPAPTAEPLPLGDAFREAVAAMLAAAPDAALELSGGLDSRLIVAAIPTAQRQHRLAITLDDSGGTSAEFRVASRVARATGLDHRHTPLTVDLGDVDETLDELLGIVVDGYDTMANPLDKLPLVLAGQDDSADARFGGQNGEIIRGFYYPMQPLAAAADAALIGKLIDWRLIANDRVAPRLFSSRGTEAMAAARAGLADRLAAFDGVWGHSLDAIYLHYRMQGWAGNAVSNRFTGRAVLWPFFDDRFIAAALALPPAAKRNSHAAYALLQTLDPSLAAIPLDNGLVPAHLVSHALTARAARWRALAIKAVRKVVQRVRPAAGTVLGADRLIDRWHAASLYRRLDLAALATLDLFDPSALDEIGCGKWKPDRPTLGFLLLCNRLVTR